ncbi:MAG: hypothetical protein HZA88_21820 [Verrucomicrobia bacterium]|nr:hypothetical protein [Verrucomicrobiota bacterium]
MNTGFRRRFCSSGLVFLLSVPPLFAGNPSPTQPPVRELATAYIEGVEALETADYKRAVDLISRAIAGDEENADYLRARGVANTLAENFPAAIADLQRALRLRGDDYEAKLWLAAACRMGGDPATGSQYFSVRGVPPNYADMVYNNMAMDYWSSRTHGSYYDRETKQQVAVREPVKKLFPEAARAYAQRHKATGPAANQLVIARMKLTMARGDWAAALNDLGVLRQTEPDDAVLRGDMARCLLGGGDALHAREEFTRALCIQPLWADGYLGRAQAAAMLGDVRRAGADLETAVALGTKTDDAKDKMSRLAAPRVIGDAVAEFARRVESDADTGVLVEAALALHRSFNAVRLRYDEAYQDRIWAMRDAIRGEPKSADRYEMLGRFLFDHHIVPVVWNGPRATEQLRPQSHGERAQELQRAIESSDAALKLDGRNVNAMATKGWVFYRLRRSGNPEALADQGLGVEPRNVRAMALKSRILLDRAADMEGAAKSLRSGHTDESRETRSDGSVWIKRTHYPPTAQQLAEASLLDEKAAACRKEAGRLDNEATRVKSQVVPALVADGNKALGSMFRSLKSARHVFEEAYGCDPDNRDVLKGLAEVFKRQGDARPSHAFGLLAGPMQHTTAVEALKPAWDACVRTAWKSASEALDRAAQLDPADARAPAYRSVVAEGRGDTRGAGRQRRAALALEEARARLMGTSFVAPNNVPLRLHEPGLPVAVRLQHGSTLSAAGQHDEALKTYSANLSIEKRFTKDEWVQLVPTAMLPDPQQDPAKIPDAPSLASLMAWSRLGAARTLIAVGRPAEAQQEFRAIRACLANWPATAKDRETMNVVDSWARLGIAEAAVAAKDYDTAFKLLMSGEGWPWNLPQNLETQRKALAEKVRLAREQASVNEMNAPMRLSPAEQRARRMQDDIAQLQKQRDGMAAELNNPNLPAADRRALLNSIAELDRQIASRKAAASRYQQAPEESKQAPPQGTRGRRF